MEDMFLQGLAEALQRDAAAILPGDAFRDYEEWDSLAVLSVMAMIEEQYGVLVSRKDLDACVTVGDLHSHVVNGKK
jgi:acyl carrier protein